MLVDFHKYDKCYLHFLCDPDIFQLKRDFTIYVSILITNLCQVQIIMFGSYTQQNVIMYIMCLCFWLGVSVGVGMHVGGSVCLKNCKVYMVYIYIKEKLLIYNFSWLFPNAYLEKDGFLRHGLHILTIIFWTGNKKYSYRIRNAFTTRNTSPMKYIIYNKNIIRRA